MGADFAGWADRFWFFEVKFRGSGAAKSRLKLSIPKIKQQLRKHQKNAKKNLRELREFPRKLEGNSRICSVGTRGANPPFIERPQGGEAYQRALGLF